VLDRELYAIAVAPLLAPDPIAWLCPMFRIDDDFAREIKVYTNLEITFSMAPTCLARRCQTDAPSLRCCAIAYSRRSR